jgi:phage baseplate assembly protein W
MKPVLNTPNRIIFSDVNPDVTMDGPFELVFNEDSIVKSLETCFTTPKYSRLFRRQFGSKLNDLLFQPMDDITANAIAFELKQVAQDWENRITNISVIVLPDISNQQYYVDVSYRIPMLGNKMVSYKFNISQGAAS